MTSRFQLADTVAPNLSAIDEIDGTTNPRWWRTAFPIPRGPIIICICVEPDMRFPLKLFPVAINAQPNFENCCQRNVLLRRMPRTASFRAKLNLTTAEETTLVQAVNAGNWWTSTPDNPLLN